MAGDIWREIGAKRKNSQITAALAEYPPGRDSSFIREISTLQSIPMLKANLTLMRKRIFVVAAAIAQLCSPHRTYADGFIDPQLAMKQFKAPAGFKVDLWAAEPQVKNPAALCLDEQGRVYVAETYRLVDAGVFDIRGHMNLYTEDLACRTVEDRAAMILRHYQGKLGEFTNATEVVRLLEDKGGVGH